MGLGYADDLGGILGGMGENAYDRLNRIISPFFPQGIPTDRPNGNTRPGTPLDLATLGDIFNQNKGSFNPTQFSFLSQILSQGEGAGPSYTLDDSFAKYFGSNTDGFNRFQDILNRHAGRKGFNDILGQSGGVFGLDQLKALLSSTDGKYDNFTNATALGFMAKVLQDMQNYNPNDPGGGGGGGDGGGGGGDGTGTGDRTGNPVVDNWFGGPGGPDPTGEREDPFITMLREYFTNRLEGPFGVPREIIDDNRASLQGAASQREQAGLQQIAQIMNSRGQLNSGTQARLSRDMSEQAGNFLQQGLLGLETNYANQALADKQQANSEALNFAGLLGNMDLGFAGLDLQDLLGNRELDLRGQLGNRQLDLTEAGFLFDSRLQEWLMARLFGLGA